MENNFFPTEFATSLGEESNLMVKHRRGMDHAKYVKRNKMMQGFQKMAMANSFDDCLIAFHGVKLKKKHLECLKVIYKSTRPWTLGHATTVLLSKLESPTLAGRDAKEITAAIVEHLNPDSGDKSKGGGRGSGGKLIVNATFEEK